MTDGDERLDQDALRRKTAPQLLLERAAHRAG